MNLHSYICCNNSSKEYNKIATISSLLKLLNDESRLKILCILRQGTHCVCELTKHTTLSQSLISHHLKHLKNAQLVQDKKQRQRVYYTLTNKGKTVTDSIFTF